MSLANYTGLVTAAASSWMHRSDITTSQADEFIQLFESDFNSTMRVRQMEAQTAAVSTAGYLLHPTNWVGWKEIKGTLNGATYDLEPVTDEVANIRTFGETSTSTPRFYKVRGDRTYLYPSASGITLNCVFYDGVPALTGSATTNWLLTKYPGAYLFGMLISSNLFTIDDRYATWVAAYDRIIENIKADSRKGEWSGQVLRMHPAMSWVP